MGSWFDQLGSIIDLIDLGQFCFGQIGIFFTPDKIDDFFHLTKWIQLLAWSNWSNFHLTKFGKKNLGWFDQLGEFLFGPMSQIPVEN